MVDISGPSAEDRSVAEAPKVAAEAGSVFSVQCDGANPSYVHVCPPGSLDGLCLVCDWPQRNGEQ